MEVPGDEGAVVTWIPVSCCRLTRKGGADDHDEEEIVQRILDDDVLLSSKKYLFLSLC